MVANPKVTIAIPTYNRAKLLSTSLESALSQDYPNLEILVLDNASADDTQAVVRSYSDPRITYIRNETNIGLFRNLNRTLELNTSPYVSILQDDDVILPGFVRESVLALETHPQAALSFTHVRFIDIEGTPSTLQDTTNVPTGLINGRDYLHQIVNGDNLVVHVSSAMMRASALAEKGTFDILHQKHAMEFNLYFRLAAHFDLVFVPQELTQVRFHANQDHANTVPETGALAMVAERTDAVAYLLQSDRAQDAAYRNWLTERLLYISRLRSEYTGQLVPGLSLPPSERLQLATQDIETLIPEGTSFILIDETVLGNEVFPGRKALPFLERDGHYYGPPPDDDTAIKELERMRQQSAHFMAFAWPSFWWFDYYSGLRDYLYSRFRCVLKNGRLIIFDLQQELKATDIARSNSHNIF